MTPYADFCVFPLIYTAFLMLRCRSLGKSHDWIKVVERRQSMRGVAHDMSFLVKMVLEELVLHTEYKPMT